MQRWITALIATVTLFGAVPARAQEATPGPGLVEVSIIPGGFVFFTEDTDTNEPSFGNYDLGGAVAINLSRFVGFEGEVNGDKGTSQALLDRAEGLDAPDDIKGAQQQVVLSFELRHDALEGIAAQLKGLSAGGKEADKAGKAIYTQMKVLSASDILFARAQDQIEQALIDNDVTVDNGVPSSQFLPDDPDYLDPAVTADALGGVATSSGGTTSDASCKDDGETHGLGLVDGSTLLQPSGTALTNGGTVAAVSGDNEIEVAVQNQGTADESNINVDVSSDSGISESGTIDQIAAGETQTVKIPLQPEPKAGDSVTIDVDVATVPCEQVADNNKASYTVTF